MRNQKDCISWYVYGTGTGAKLSLSHLYPFAVGIPGVKLGLTNIVTVIMLYIAAPMETFLLCVFRAVLSGFMFWKCVQHHIFTGRLYTKLYRYVTCLRNQINPALSQ